MKHSIENLVLAEEKNNKKVSRALRFLRNYGVKNDPFLWIIAGGYLPGKLQKKISG